MTSSECLFLLKDCLAAFHAMGSAVTSKALMVKMGNHPRAFSGSGQEQLRQFMIDKINGALDIDQKK